MGGVITLSIHISDDFECVVVEELKEEPDVSFGTVRGAHWIETPESCTTSARQVALQYAAVARIAQIP